MASTFATAVAFLWPKISRPYLTGICSQNEQGVQELLFASRALLARLGLP